MNIKKVSNLLKDIKTYTARCNHAYFILLSHENKKLKPNSRVSFLIWNIPSIITCPYATDHCIQFCYARKTELFRGETVTNSRQKHLEISRNPDFVDRMIFTISAELDRPINKNKKVVFRIHESGDFYNREYVKKWFDIMNYFKDDKRIVFVAYTKSVIFFDGLTIPENMYLLASVWDDTTPENLDIIRRNNFRIYTAFNKKDMKTALKNNYAFCPCKDCGSCGLCWNNYANNIACQIH